MNTDPTVQFGREAAKYLTSAVHSDAEALAELIKTVNPSGGAVLDIATGAGHMAFAMAPFVDRVVATDPTPAMLEVTAAEATKRELTNLSTGHAYAEDLPFSDEEFDGLTCRVAAHHFLNVDKFLRECYRVTKPGGWLLLVDTVSPDDEEAAETLNHFEALRDPSHKWNLTVPDWQDRVEELGYATLDVKVRRKTLNLQDWMDRMSVSREDQTTLREIAATSTGDLRSYLNPTETTFELHEMTLFVKKPS